MIGHPLELVTVRQKPGTSRSQGLLKAGERMFPCLLGRSGISSGKHEGDGATPSGRYQLLFGFFRPDRLNPPATSLPFWRLTPLDGWCDEPGHPAYNRMVRLPFAASHEKLWRDDSLYDICLVLDHNFTYRQRGRGSAVFFHLTADKPYTAGCIAVGQSSMLKLLPNLRTGTIIDIRL